MIQCLTSLLKRAFQKRMPGLLCHNLTIPQCKGSKYKFISGTLKRADPCERGV